MSDNLCVTCNLPAGYRPDNLLARRIYRIFPIVLERRTHMKNLYIHYIQRYAVSHLTMRGEGTSRHAGAEVLPMLRLSLLLLALLVGGAARLSAQDNPVVPSQFDHLKEVISQVDSSTIQVDRLTIKNNCLNMSHKERIALIKRLQYEYNGYRKNLPIHIEANVNYWESQAHAKRIAVEKLKSELANANVQDIEHHIADAKREICGYILPDKLIDQADIDQKSKQVEHLITENNMLQLQLPTLNNAHPNIDKQIADLEGEIQKIEPLVSNRSLADIQEDLSRKQTELDGLKKQLQNLIPQPKSLVNYPIKIMKSLIVGGPANAWKLWKPENILCVVCRQQLVATFDDDIILGNFRKYVKDNSITNQYVAEHPGEFDDAVNKLEQKSTTFSVRFKTTDSRHISLSISPKYNDDWEKSDNIYQPSVALLKLKAPSSAEEIRRMISTANSKFCEQLTQKNPEKTLVRFFVWNDTAVLNDTVISSFDTYLYAANIAKRAGFHTTWIPYDTDKELVLYLGQTELHGID